MESIEDFKQGTRSRQLNVRLSEEEIDFVKGNKLSPTKIFRSKLKELMNKHETKDNTQNSIEEVI